MKKFGILVAFVICVFASVNCFGQKKVYCEIVGYANLLNTKVSIVVDYGQKTHLFADNRIVNEDGKVKKFNSMVDALNYMGDLGWSFEQAYTITHGNSNVYHFLLSKVMVEDEVMQIETKSSFKENADDTTEIIADDSEKSHNKMMKEELKRRKMAR